MSLKSIYITSPVSSKDTTIEGSLSPAETAIRGITIKINEAINLWEATLKLDTTFDITAEVREYSRYCPNCKRDFKVAIPPVTILKIVAHRIHAANTIILNLATSERILATKLLLQVDIKSQKWKADIIVPMLDSSGKRMVCDECKALFKPAIDIL